jgi:hypothetical protein
MKFSQFMASTAGRLLRVTAGLFLIVIGIILNSAAGYILAGIGLLPLMAGIFDWCIFAPLLGMPFSGRAIRASNIEPRK